MEVLVARPAAGFCIGIERAYRKMSEHAAREDHLKVAHQNAGGPFDTLTRIERGEPELLAEYPGLGRLSVVRDTSTLQKGDRLVLGFHGLKGNAQAQLAARGVDVVEDLICPFIAKLDRVVERLATEGYDIAIVGLADNPHCEDAKRVAGEHGRRCHVIERPDDLDRITGEPGPVALVGQVTGNTQIFTQVLERIRTRALPIKVVKTMCSDSYKRQRAALDLAERSDVIVLLDDGGGAAQSVFEVCATVGKPVHRIRRKEDLRPEWFAGVATVGVVAGIVMPSWAVAEAARHIEAMAPVS